MGKKAKRKFIDATKEKVHKFKLVHRSQQDPLAAEGAAAQHVLAEVKQKKKKKDILAEEFGIYVDPDDDYDYLQHIKDVEMQTDAYSGCQLEEVYTIRRDDVVAKNAASSKKKLLLPSTAFESAVEESVGLLNKDVQPVGPQLAFDPDIVAELDREDDDNRNEMEDDFVMMLNGETLPQVEEEEDEEDSDSSSSSGSDSDHDESYDGQNFKKFMYGYKPKQVAGKDQGDADSDGFEDMDSDNFSDDGFEMEDFDFESSKPKTRDQQFKALSELSKYTKATNRTEPQKHMDANFVATFMQEYLNCNDDAMTDEARGRYHVEDDYIVRLMNPAGKKSEEQREKESEESRKKAIQFIKERMKLNDGDPNLPERYTTVDIEMKTPGEPEAVQVLKPPEEGEGRASRKRPRYEPSVVSFNFTNKKRKLTEKTHQVLTHQEPVRPESDGAALLATFAGRLQTESKEEKKARKKAVKELKRNARERKKLAKLETKEEFKIQKKLLMNQKAMHLS